MSEFKIGKLQTEYLCTPLGLDVKNPRFSWQMQSETIGKRQSSYRVQVGTRPGTFDMWDSGRIESSVSHCVAYGGSPLKSCTKYYWQVTVTDETGVCNSAESFFETGFLETGIDAWDGAQWIGAEENNLCAATKGVFTLASTFSITEGTCGGIVFGACDPRLTDKNKNTYLLAGENYIAYVIDASAIPAKLHIYRVGYAPGDSADEPFCSIDIKDMDTPGDLIIDETNKNEFHTLRIDVTGNAARAYIDGKLVDDLETAVPYDPAVKRKVGRQLNPLGSNDVITYPRLNKIGFYAGADSTVHYKNIEVRDIRPPKAVVFYDVPGREDSLFADITAVEQGCFAVSSGIVTADPSHGASPMLRREFVAAKPVDKARLYATARGVYECHINGKRIGEDWFQPGASQFDKHLYYQAYDITDTVRQGGNAIGFYLGSGWWSDSQTFAVSNYNYYGDRPSLLAKIVLTYTDGSTEIIVSEQSTWQCSADGPVLYASFFHGEHHDARKYNKYCGFAAAGYTGGVWQKPAVIAPVPDEGNPAWPNPNLTEPAFVGQMDHPVQTVTELTAKTRAEPRPGVFIYDMGQNMVGVPRIRLQGKAGEKITIRYSEVLYPALPAYDGLHGLPLMENLRDASCTDIYICSGAAEELFQPHFTFHGYRYVEITGAENPPDPEAVKGLVLSSVTALTGAFSCSDELVNRLYENVLWSQRGNFISIPTDCPQRNERMGWMGDAQVFARSALYNANVRTLYGRYMQAVRDVQEENGRFADIAPIGGGFGGIIWGSAGLIIPWEVYNQCGDERILAENYAAMQQYMAYLEENYGDGLLQPGIGNIGDWLAADMSTDNDLLWTAYFVYDAKLMAAMAGILNRPADAKHYKELFLRAQSDWNTRFTDASGRTITIDGKVNDTQCSYAVPLAFGVANEKNRFQMAAHLNRKTEELGHTLTTGFVGTAAINQALTEYGYEETAYRLLRQTEYPSWLYSVTQGATTIWERWNSYTTESGFGGNNSMNSFNHYSLGAVAAWFYRCVLGIHGDPGNPGYQKFILKPSIGGFDFACGSYESNYGMIKSSWKKQDRQVEWTITIPANTGAKVYAPAEHILVNDRMQQFEKEKDSISGKPCFYKGLPAGKYTLQWTL